MASGEVQAVEIPGAFRRVGALPGVWVAAGLTTAVLFVLYLRTMLPGVSVGDWAEMQFVPALLEVPHPTGYPLYVLLGKLFSLLPFGSVAWRAGLLSVVAASAAGGVAALIAGRLGMRPLIAGLVGLTLGVTGTLWQEATFPEMNGLHLLLMALLLHRALVWHQERRDRDLLIGALLSGLAVANHLLAATAVPLVVIAVLFDARRRLLARPVLLLQAAALALAGVALYLFIPLRALAGPPQLYADLATWDGFWNLVKGETFRRDMHFMTGESVAAAWRAVPDIVAHLEGRSSPLFVVGGIAGIALIRERRVALVLAALAIVNVYFYVNYVGDLHHYLLLTWLILALGAGVLGEWTVRRLEAASKGATRGAEVLLVLLPLAILVGQLPVQDQSRNRTGEDLSARIFAALPPNAVLLSYWDTLTMLGYEQCMEGVRPDVRLRAYDPTARATCDSPPPPLEDELRAGRPTFALFPFPQFYEPLDANFRLIRGPTFDLPYGQRYLDHTGVLYEVRLRE